MAGLLQWGATISIRSGQDVSRCAAFIREAGLEWVQLNLETPDWTERDLSEWTGLLQDYDLEIGAVGCYANLLRPHETSAQGASIVNIQRAIACAPLLGASKFAAWSGTFAEELFESHPDNTSLRGRAVLQDSLLELLPVLEDNDAQLVIEPHWMHALNTPEACLDFIAGLPNNRVTFVSDPASFITPENYTNRNDCVAVSIELLKRHISLVHLKDLILNNEGNLESVGPGQGSLDYPAFLAQWSALAVPLLAVMECVPLERLGEAVRWLQGRMNETS